MSDQSVREVLDACRQLLKSIDEQNWTEYAALCDSTLTAFEPEACGHLATGLDFHHFYFQLENDGKSRQQSTISSPDVRVVGDCAVVGYVRLTQRVDREGRVTVGSANETRVWQKSNGQWKHIHFHRSPC